MEIPIKVKDFINQCKERKIIEIVDKQGFRVGEYNYYPNHEYSKFIWFNGTGLVESKIKDYLITKIIDVEE